MQRQTTIWSAEDDLLTLITNSVILAPTQQRVADQLLAESEAGNVCLLQAGDGMGKTTVLRWLHARMGGVFIAARNILSSGDGHNKPSVSIVFVDDAHLMTPARNVTAGLKNRCVLSYVSGAKLNFGPGRAKKYAIRKFEPDDYSAICRRYLGDSAERLDLSAIHRTAPALNGYQLKHACLCLGLRYAAPTTEAFLDAL